MRELAPNAIVLFGGRYEFRPDEKIHQPCVQSRMLLSCVAGCGTIRVNQRRIDLHEGVFVWMPWNHSLEYKADSQTPMIISGAHIVPDYRPRNQPLKFFIPHFSNDQLRDVPERRDCKISGLEGIIAGEFEKGDGLHLIGSYISEWMWHRDRDEESARFLARLLIAELHRSVTSRHNSLRMESGLLKHMRAYIKHRINEKITLRELASNARCSIPTLTRQCRKYCGCSPISLVIKLKINYAEELLRSTDLRIGEVGERVGVDDLYYFSRLFKKESGLTPSDYRKRHALL